MKFKEFWNISTKSEEPHMKESLDRYIKNNSPKYEQLVEESMSLDTQRRLIHVLEKVLGELDPEQDQQSILDLEYIIRLYTEWADLSQEILANLKTVNRSEVVEEELEEGEEWKKIAGLQKKETKEKYVLEPQNQLAQEAVESMDSRIDEIQEEIESSLHDFEKTSPKAFERFFEIVDDSPKENRTN